MAGRIYDGAQLQVVPAFGAPLRPIEPIIDIERHQREASARFDEERRAMVAERAQLEALKVAYFDRVRELAELTQKLARPDSNAVVDLAMVVAREIIGSAMDVDRSLILNSIEEGLQQVAGEEQVQVRMGSEEIKAVTALRPELAKRVALVVDDSLPEGGCIIESSRSVVDRSLGPRLEAVRNALLNKLDHQEKEAA